MSYEA
jgi:hypothetical protein